MRTLAELKTLTAAGKAARVASAAARAASHEPATDAEKAALRQLGRAKITELEALIEQAVAAGQEWVRLDIGEAGTSLALGLEEVATPALTTSLIPFEFTTEYRDRLDYDLSSELRLINPRMITEQIRVLHVWWSDTKPSLVTLLR